MRTYNLRLVLWLVGILLVTAIVVHFVHDYQVQRNAGVYLELATKEAAIVLDEQRGADEEQRTEREQAAENALKYYQRYLALEPDNVEARADYGKLLAQVGALGDAYFQLERVLREDSTNDEIRKFHVELAIRLRKFADAEFHLKVLLETVGGKESAPLLEQCGFCMMQSGRNEDAVGALASFDAAIAVAPERISTYGLKATLLRDRLHNAQAASETIVAMVETNPESAEAHLIYASFLLEKTDLAEAVEAKQRLATATKECTRALELNPRHADGLALAASCAQQGGRYGEAIEMLRKSIGLKRDVAKRYLQLANVELLAKRADPVAGIDAAINAIREGLGAISDKTATFDLRWRLADLLAGKEDKTEPEVAEAKALRAELAIEQPASPLLAYLDARQLFEDQKWIEAERALDANRESLASWPDLQTKTDQMLGHCYMQSGEADLELGLKTFRRLLYDNPLDVESRQRYAEALVGAGQLAEALNEYELLCRVITQKSEGVPEEFFKRHFVLKLVEMLQRPKDQRDWVPLKLILTEVVKTTPNDPWAPIMSAEILVAAGNLEAARHTLETAVQTMENEPSLLMALADVAQQQDNNEEAARRLAEAERVAGDTIEIRLAKAGLLIHQEGKDGLPKVAQFVHNVDKLAAAEQTPEQLAQLYWRLAQLCWSQQDASLGVQYGRQAAELLPSNLPFRMTLLRNAQLTQDIDAARQLVVEIQSIDRGGALTLYSQAVYDVTSYLADKAKGQVSAAVLRQARDKLLQAQRMRPTWAQIPLMLGDIASEQEDEDAALSSYQRAVELGSRGAETCVQVASILYRRGRFSDADAVVKLFESQPSRTTPEIGRLASHISYFRDDFERALAMAKIPVEQAKTPRGDDLLFLGRLFAIHGQFADAQVRIQQAIDLDPTDDTAYLAMVQLLVAASQQAETDGQPADAKRLFADAERAMAEAEQRVEMSKRAQTVAHCLDFLGKPDVASQRFERAVDDAPHDPKLLEAAARFYVRYPQFRDKAEPILKRFVLGQVTDDKTTVGWARRELAQILVRASGYQNFLEALRLTDVNLHANPDSVEDLELRAQLLSSRLLLSLKKEAVESLERRAALSPPMKLESTYLLAQLYLSLGRWGEASKLMESMIAEAKRSGSPKWLSVCLRAYVTALLDHDQVSDAKTWLGPLKRLEPKELRTALLEARTLGPPMSLAPDAVTSPCRAKDALQVLKTVVEDREVHALPAKHADETDDEYALRDTDAKKEAVVRLLEDFLQRVARTGVPADADVFRATIDQYYAEIVASDPGRKLTQVPYLVRQGRRKEAVKLTTRKENWEAAQIWTLIAACEAVLTDLQKHLTPAAKEIGQSVSNSGETAILQKQVQLQSVAIEEVLQHALVKYRGELEVAQPQDREDKINAVAAILSLLADHDVCVAYADPQRYKTAADRYKETLNLQPINVVAIRNLAQIIEANGENLDTSLAKIDQAVALHGPLPMVLDAQAMILLGCGEPRRALVAAKQVIREKPEDVDPATDEKLAKNWGKHYFHLALMYDATRNTSEASNALQEAVQLGFGETDVCNLERPKWQRLVEELGFEPTVAMDRH